MEMEISEEKEFISERQASLLLGVSAVSLFAWRKKGIIPKNIYSEKRYPYSKRVFYKKSEFLLWTKSFTE